MCHSKPSIHTLNVINNEQVQTCSTIKIDIDELKSKAHIRVIKELQFNFAITSRENRFGAESSASGSALYVGFAAKR